MYPVAQPTSPWWREMLMIWLKYLAVIIVSIPAGALYVWLSKLGTDGRLGLTISVCICLLCSFYLQQYLNRRLFSTHRLEDIGLSYGVTTQVLGILVKHKSMPLLELALLAGIPEEELARVAEALENQDLVKVTHREDVLEEIITLKEKRFLLSSHPFRQLLSPLPNVYAM
jgi:hypothetical protein